jgi:hypothetical protein
MRSVFAGEGRPVMTADEQRHADVEFAATMLDRAANSIEGVVEERDRYRAIVDLCCAEMTARDAKRPCGRSDMDAWSAAMGALDKAVRLEVARRG